MLLTITLLLSAMLPPAPAAAEHDFHLSKCLVEYSPAEQTLQISLHLFIDDLEEALRRRGADKLHLCTRLEAADAETHLERYLRQHFTIRLNGKPVEYAFLGKEISDDLAAVWCYLEVPEVRQVQSLSVTNTLLMEVFDDQKNVVSVTGPNRKQGLLLFQKGRTTESVTF